MRRSWLPHRGGTRFLDLSGDAHQKSLFPETRRGDPFRRSVRSVTRLRSSWKNSSRGKSLPVARYFGVPKYTPKKKEAHKELLSLIDISLVSKRCQSNQVISELSGAPNTSTDAAANRDKITTTRPEEARGILTATEAHHFPVRR